MEGEESSSSCRLFNRYILGIVFFQSYSALHPPGKTTLLKSQAVRLAQLGEDVTYIFLEGISGGPEAVMSLATKLQMSNYPTVTTLSVQDLETFYRKFHPWRFTPSPLTLMKFYIEKKKPSNVLVDEAPLETSWGKFLMRILLQGVYNQSNQALLATLLLMSISLVAVVCQKPLEAVLLSWAPFVLPGIAIFPRLGSSASEGTCNVALRLFISVLALVLAFCSGLELMLTNWSLRPFFMLLLCLWYLGGFKVCPFSLPQTASYLLSLPPLLPSSSSTLWLALHSVPLLDTMRGVDKSVSVEEVEEFRKSLAQQDDVAQTFLTPTLRHNLRNSHVVAKTQARPGYDWGQHTKVLPTASPPKPRSCLPPAKEVVPLLLPLASKSDLTAAIAHAWESLGSPATLVTLLDNVNLLEAIKDGFTQKNLAVTTYFFTEDRTSCEAFLKNPSGVLVTNGRLFSGMEAATVIWVTGSNREMDRSNKLRAIERLCIIDTDVRDTADIAEMKREKRFMKCQLPWLARVMWCKSCGGDPILCPHCATVCHQDCQKEWHVTKFLIRLVLPYNSCSCRASGKCQL